MNNFFEYQEEERESNSESPVEAGCESEDNRSQFERRKDSPPEITKEDFQELKKRFQVYSKTEGVSRTMILRLQLFTNYCDKLMLHPKEVEEVLDSGGTVEDLRELKKFHYGHYSEVLEARI